MKVAFWSSAGITDRVPGYIAAIGTMLTTECNCKVVLGSNYISNCMLQDCFFSKMKEEGVAHSPYLYVHDSPEYHAALWSMKRNRQGNLLEVPMEGIKIIYPPDVAEKKMFYYDVPKSAFYLLHLVGENNASFYNALDEADIVVAFLSQNAAEIQKFFTRFSSLIPKTLFVIEVRQRKNRKFRRDFLTKFGVDIRNIGIIPYNSEYIEACTEGKLEYFIKNAANASTQTSQYNFVSKLRSITKLLYDRSFCE